ncbi:MAG: hypothetical protein V2I56_23565 [Desulfobacteraceae bacterium]|jgi:hypothetical protein|nr:hypothetical protein [Desulfobacteraceae bacterium]
MQTTYDSRKIEKILSEADELLNQLNSGLIEDMEKYRRTQLEIHASELKRRKLEISRKAEKRKAPDSGSFGEGIHEAIDEIVKAMGAMKRYLT